MEVTYKGRTYDEAVLEDMTRKDLAALYNEIAEELGFKTLKQASTHQEAVARVLKMLRNVKTTKKVVKRMAPPSAVSTLSVPKAARGRPIRRLTRRLCSTVVKVRAPEPNQRLKFWPKYADELTLREVVETNGLDDTQVRYWLKLGCMKLKPAAEEEYQRQLELFNAG